MKGEISLNGVKSTRFNFNRLDGGDPIINKKNSKIYSKLKYIKKNYQLYLFFTLPPLILLIIFKYIPMGGVLIAFEDYSAISGVFHSQWVGLKHFERFLSSPDFMTLLMNTLKVSLYGILWGFPLPIILALLLARIKSEGIKKKIQLILYAPNFISVIVISGMIIVFLSPIGPVNQFFGTATNFMAMPSAFRTIYVASSVWQATGWASIIYTAALSNASQELTEAAVIDGANIFQQILNVDLPAIKPIMVIQFILSAGNIMSVGFEKALALQTDLNLPTSEILPTYVYKMGLLNGDYSFSTAVGLFNSVINIVLLIVVNSIVKKLNEGEGI
ncbi:putative multiple-sugar transport system permease YteP [Clostridium beijerinckii]|uniref:ABC transporter permease n=1 Tax=Clostridium sp. YIM B02500 TaxID=2910681 RepID=UPI000983CFAE|nr:MULTISPECIES: ABC transporter permease subunit [Clostridium]AQS06698.1 putative multiple-sugar transport system permease YteP [Clostridium beijerinckii]OOM32423.1 putative multiple-sugar transport system permease YteP [Clostridium beijerinckii]OOM39216.1 putative multiple-sugar transport system permease YteP [Clostridium beijerinckii]OOM55925.1 putative multiple-sugar transport system permease YteP [Clostridium beijerinckii]OOM67143.1 putative multiple-sugar transport system permease YteP [